MTAAVIAACDATDGRSVGRRDRGGPGLIRLRGEKSDAKRALDDAGNISVGVRGRQLSRAAVYLPPPRLPPALFSGSQNSCHVGSYHFPHLVPAASLLKVAGSRYAVSPRTGAVGAVRVRTRVGVALMNRVSNRPFSLQVVSQAEGSACCMDGSGRSTAMICLPVVHFNDGRIDGRLVGRLNAASATTTFHALSRKTSEVGLSLILQLLRARTPPAGRGPFHS